MRRWPAIALGGALLATGLALAVVAVRGPAPPHSMDDRVRQIAQSIRCPDCVDLSVADSPSPTARHIRVTIEQQLRDGRSPGEIRDYFVAHFGSSILLTPRGAGIDLLAWIAPAFLAAAGLGLLVLALRRWSRRRPETDSPVVGEADRVLLERELASADLEAE